MRFEELGIWAFGIFVVTVIGIVIIVLFLYLPVQLYTEAECLRKGYPKASVTIGLERYCLTLDGAVTVKVDKAEKGERR